MKKYLLAVISFAFLQSPAQDTISPRRLKLDSMSSAFNRQMQHLDSTVKRLDVIMDSITGKRTRQDIDSIALYKLILEQNKREQRQKKRLMLQAGGIAVGIILVISLWRRWKKRNPRGIIDHK